MTRYALSCRPTDRNSTACALPHVCTAVCLSQIELPSVYRCVCHTSYCPVCTAVGLSHTQCIAQCAPWRCSHRLQREDSLPGAPQVVADLSVSGPHASQPCTCAHPRRPSAPPTATKTAGPRFRELRSLFLPHTPASYLAVVGYLCTAFLYRTRIIVREPHPPHLYWHQLLLSTFQHCQDPHVAVPTGATRADRQTNRHKSLGQVLGTQAACRQTLIMIVFRAPVVAPRARRYRGTPVP